MIECGSFSVACMELTRERYKTSRRQHAEKNCEKASLTSSRRARGFLNGDGQLAVVI